MAGDTLFTPDKPEALSGRRFHVDAVRANTKILGKVPLHGRDVLTESWRLSNDRQINITHRPPGALELGHHRTQQIPTVRPTETLIGVGKMPTNITKSCST